MVTPKKNRCGMCGHEVDDWEKHVAGKEHQANLADPYRVKNIGVMHKLQTKTKEGGKRA